MQIHSVLGRLFSASAGRRVTSQRWRLLASVSGGAIAAVTASTAFAQTTTVTPTPGGGSAVTVASPVGSATAVTSPGGQLEEVVVTANRRAQSVQNVPYAISAVSGAAIARNNITNIYELSHEIPGVNTIDKGAFAGISNNSVIIHGLNVEAVGGIGANFTESPVATYVDDAPVFVNLRLNDIDRVEVLRGPQGTLYGSGSLGGTIRYLQHDADPSQYQVVAWTGVSSTDHASEPNYNGNIIVNLPVTSTFALRFQAGDDHEAGFIDMPNLYKLGSDGSPALAQPGNILSSPPVFAPAKDTNDSTYHTYRIAALWRPTDNLTLRLNYNYQQAIANGAPQINPTVYGYTLNNAAYLRQTLDDRINLYSGDIAYNMGFATVTASTSVYDHRAVAHDDVTRVYENFSFYTAYYGSDPRPIVTGINTLKDQGVTEEIRLSSKPSTFIEYVGGLYYSNESTKTSVGNYNNGYNDFFNACEPVYGFGSSQCGLGELYGVDATENNIPVEKDLSYVQAVSQRFIDRAMYTEVTWHILPKLQVTGGARVFNQTLAESGGSGLLFVGPQDVAFTNSSTSYTSAIGKADVSYKISPNMTTYFNWSQGFRRGQINALPLYTEYQNFTTPKAAFVATPDTVDNFEWGVKGKFDRFTYDFAAYNIQWHNIQAEVAATPIVVGAVLNVGDGYSRGIDLALSGYLTDNIFGQLNYSLNESKLTSISSVAVQTATSLFVGGGRFPGVPENQLNWRFEYQQSVGNDLQMRYGVDGNYRTGSSSTISANSSVIPGFAMWNIYAAATYKALTARLFVNNLNNTLGITARGNVADTGVDSPFFVSTPRTIGLSLTYTFGALR